MSAHDAICQAIVSDPATNDAMNNNQENQTIPFITGHYWSLSLAQAIGI